MKLLLGGVFTTDQVYKEFADDFIIETYANINVSNIIDYKEISDIIYQKHFKNKKYDILIGHSMGGLIILYLLQKGYNLNAKKIIICETYLKTPSVEFRNIIFNNPVLEENLKAIMAVESKRYHQEIRKSLRDLDIRLDVCNLTKPLIFVYGMRALDEKSFRRALDFIDSPNIKIIGIPKASHFCLIEKADEFKKLI